MHQWSSLLDACVVLDYPGCFTIIISDRRYHVSILCEEGLIQPSRLTWDSLHGSHGGYWRNIFYNIFT